MNFFSQKAAYATARLAERLTPVCRVRTKYGDIDFYCPSHVTVWRAETLLTKEPDTIKWIDEFESGKVFWDIGANIGCYSLYAGKRGVKTCAFEPVSSNYYVLNRNIELNSLSSTVSAYPVAFSYTNHVGKIKLSEETPGSALHNLEIDMPQKGGQGAVGITIDTYLSLFRTEVPTYIKIDVDGNERDILAGAKETLQDKRVKSILVELDEQDTLYEGIILGLKQKGLILKKKVRATECSTYETTYNHIFEKEI